MSWEEPVEVVEDALWTSPQRGFMDMSNWEETPNKTQDKFERLWPEKNLDVLLVELEEVVVEILTLYKPAVS